MRSVEIECRVERLEDRWFAGLVCHWRVHHVALLLILFSCARSAGQEIADEAIDALQKKCVEAVRNAEKSVVAIARVVKDEGAAGYQTPNLGRLGLNTGLEETFPTDPNYLPTDFGAGVVIDSSGLILTTYHVLGDAKQADYYVWSRHKPFRATIVAADGWMDLAVLKIPATDLVAIPMSEGKEVEKGRFVLAIGNPQAIARDGEMSATWGMISNVKRRAPRVPERATVAGRETLHHYGTLLQFDKPLHIGYSGGPLLDLDGKMLGLITAYSGNVAAAESATFAIPVDEHFHHAVRQLKAGKAPEFGFLGLGLQAPDARTRRLGLHGALVESVMPGTPAARSEVKVGDLVTHFNGEAVFDDDDLIREVSSLPPESNVKLTLLRGADLAKREKLEASAILTKRSSATLRPVITTAPSENWRGLLVDDATAAPRDYLLKVQLPPSGGVFVTEVLPESSAWQAGLRSGLFITAIGDQLVRTARQFHAVASKQVGEVNLRVITSSGEQRSQTVSP